MKPNSHIELMHCPHCHSSLTTQLKRATSLGYPTFYCRECLSSFNEGTGTRFNFLEVFTDIVFQVLMGRLRYKMMSLRDVADFFLLRGCEFTHETVRHWEERFAPLVTEQLRAKRRGTMGRNWHVDETFIRVKGRWCYLYRAMDEDGNLVNSLLREQRDMESAQVFFEQALEMAQTPPNRVVTDRLASYPRAISEVLSEAVIHEPGSCLIIPLSKSIGGSNTAIIRPWALGRLSR